MEQENQNQTLTASPLKKELIMALAKVQGQIQNPKKDTANPFFKSKYADLATIWDSVRELMAANGLAFVQLPTVDGTKVSVTGIIYHASGESIESTITATATDAKPQSIGSAITYLRRYQMGPMIGICSEADDDGNASSGNGDKPAKEKTPGQIKGPFSHGIPKEQHDRELADAEAALPAEPKAGTTEKSQTDLGSFMDKIKSGKEASSGKTGKGVPWTLYHIETEGHGVFSTFSKTIYDDAGEACVGQYPVMIHTVPSPKGPKLLGIELKGEAQQNPNPKSKAA